MKATPDAVCAFCIIIVIKGTSTTTMYAGSARCLTSLVMTYGWGKYAAVETGSITLITQLTAMMHTHIA